MDIGGSICATPTCISGAQKREKQPQERETDPSEQLIFRIFLFSRGRSPSGLLVSYNSIRPKKRSKILTTLITKGDDI